MAAQSAEEPEEDYAGGEANAIELAFRGRAKVGALLFALSVLLSHLGGFPESTALCHAFTLKITAVAPAIASSSVTRHAKRPRKS